MRKIKIEFEYDSKEFEKHRYDAQNCPVEVLDLINAIKGLSPTKK